MNECVLCNEMGGTLICKNQLFRIILADDAQYPGFVRLIVNSHYKEMTDLSIADANSVFSAVLKIESIVRDVFNPEKINLATLGNVVAHVHWHIIPRYTYDAHYPNPVWGAVTHPDYIPTTNLLVLERELVTKLNEAFAPSSLKDCHVVPDDSTPNDTSSRA